MSPNEWLQSVAHDVRHALRSLRATPTFTSVAVATLALGLAATAAVFSIVNAALLRPLPYPRASELVDVRTRLVDGRLTTGLVSAAEIAVLTSVSTLVDKAAGYTARPVDSVLVLNDGTPVSVVMFGVTEGFFDVLGVPMSRGRSFTRDEHAPAGQDAPLALVISDGAWTRLFGRDPAIVGKTLRIADMPGPAAGTVYTAAPHATVVGVASPLVDLPHAADFWFNRRSTPQEVVHVSNVVARLRPAATIAQLRAAGNLTLQEFGRTEPSAAGREWVLRPLVTALAGDLRPVLLIVLGATLLLLALACVNVTNLLLARGMARTSEMALRMALGAGRGRIVRQLLTESTVLAAVGAGFGFAIAAMATRGLHAAIGSMLPRLDSVPLDARMLLFGLAVLLASGLVVGLMPAWRLSRADVRILLNESSRSASAGVSTSRVMASLIIAEIGLAIALVAGAGWLVQSLSRLRSIDPGFDAVGRLVVDVRTTRYFATPAAADAWLIDLVARVRAVASTGQVGAGGNAFPLRGDVIFTPNVELKGEVSDPNRTRGGYLRVAAPGYFEAMGIGVVAGRTFTDDDRRSTERVAIVNRAFVRQFYPDRDPLTGAFAFGYPTADPTTMARIVGVIDDVRFTALAEPDGPAYYVPSTQLRNPVLRPIIVVSASTGEAEALVSPIREELRRFDSQLVVKFTTAEAIVKASTARQSLGMMLMSIFGAMALLLAAIGVYGVIAYAAEQRRMELATRLALGATPGQVLQVMLSAARRLNILGLLLGVSIAYGGGRLIAASVFAIQAGDPWVLVSAGATVTAVTAAATMIPAMRASRLSPVRAIRPD